ncbi:MAG TPA: FumA C-terminus/TtdB family hydratase beta subunit [Armatimonadota bacterium]|jgi:fumarate hydratase subunit beta
MDLTTASSPALRLDLPLSRARALSLRAGQTVRLYGVMYTARDAAHARMTEALAAGEGLPFDPEGATIYYCGPTPGRPPRLIGSAGPTTSSRMDKYAPALYRAGVRATLGKGERALSVREACRETGSVYLVTVGGAGALLGSRIVAAEVVAYPELGPEAVRRIVVEDFPAWVAYDAGGLSIFPGDQPLGPVGRAD